MHLQVDRIYNLACPASPVHYQYDPIMTTKTSFMGALNVLDLARKCGARVLQASTSEIYGDPLMHPQREEYRGNVSTIGPAPAMTRASGSLKPCFLTTRDSTMWTSG